MTVYTTVVSPADLHDTRYHKPTRVSPTLQYQIPPTSYFTLYHIQQYINDLTLLPNKVHANSVLSFCISNSSFASYKASCSLKQHLNILLENSKIRRVDLDFTQFRFKKEIMQRVVALTNHIQKHGNYNVFLSITVPVDKDLLIPEEFIDILQRLKQEFISFSMINILVTKNVKRKNVEWLEMAKLAYQNVATQLRNYDAANEIFIGSIEKYIGLSFDCDVTPNTYHYDVKTLDSLISPSSHTAPNSYSVLNAHRHRMTTTVKQSVKHGEKKNMSELDFLMIWKWANDRGLGQVQLKSYLANSKNIRKLIEKNLPLLRNNPNFPNAKTENCLTLPQDMLFRLADEVGIRNVTTTNYKEPAPFGDLSSRSASTPSAVYSSLSRCSSNSSPDTVNSVGSAQITALVERLGESNTFIANDNDFQLTSISGLPDYETAMLQKVQEHEIMMNSLVKLPSYATGTYCK